MTKFFTSFAFLLAVVLLVLQPARADDPVHKLTVKNHAFSPKELTVPAGQKIKLIVKNEDPTPIEFESYELNREKVIAGNSEAVVYIDALAAGSYPFFDEFHQETTTGKIIAK